MEMLKKISADEELREKYAAREKARLDTISSIKFAEMKGMEKGMEKGKAEIIIKQFTMKFGILPAYLQERILNAALPVLDLLAENVFELNSVEEVLELIEKN
ncbi:MAG: DUF4351 domain-containing protein [Lutispora sp.]|nr:DUF4351 domain-containing protein [Lutispora sp.]